MIVLDSSAAVDYVAGRDFGRWVEQRLLDDPDLHAPHLLDVEVANALRWLVAGRKVSAGAARRALDDILELRMRRYPHAELLDRMWELRTHITPYDASYVALAEALGATLITTDTRLARSHGHRARIVAPE